MGEMSALDSFAAEVNRALGTGTIADTELEVVDDAGRAPVVVALDDERLPVLLRRVENVGGYANVFVTGESGVRRMSVMDVRGALDVSAADDMTPDVEQPSALSTVGAFVDHVERCRNGVLLPARLASPNHAAMPARQVELVVG